MTCTNQHEPEEGTALAFKEHTWDRHLNGSRGKGVGQEVKSYEAAWRAHFQDLAIVDE